MKYCTISRGLKKLVVKVCLIFGSFSLWLPAFASFDNEIHAIASPTITYDSERNYEFIVFGDTRTAEDDSKNDDKLYHKLRDWTHEEVRREMQDLGVSFALYTGDFVWRGSKDSYWSEIRTQFPTSLRSISEAKIFPVLGNHETWQEPNEGNAMTNYFATFPYLVQDRVQFHNYAFVVGDSLFVNLCSGGYGKDKEKFKQDDKNWNCEVISSFDELMVSLQSLVGRMRRGQKEIKNMFVTYHKPSYSTYEHPPLDLKNDPIQTLLDISRNNPGMKLFVFNGHNHVTEIFKPAGTIIALVAGGGGAPQKSSVPVDDHGKPMQELFWPVIDSGRYPRINYFRIKVGKNDTSVNVEERVLCVNNDVSVLGYFRGIVIDNDGVITNRTHRHHECGVGDYEWLIKK